VTISNDAWFGRSWGPHQHFQIARARSVEYGVPLIRATNTGITALVDYRGQVLEAIPQFEQRVLTARISIENRLTPYAKAPFLSLLCVVSIILLGTLSLLNVLQKITEK
jgi:apolipoprotein N-acyltransferase